jgi:hypothetical protein
MAKVFVVSDNAGNIVATAQSGKTSHGVPTMHQIRPRNGQHVHELEIDASLGAPEVIHKLHATHRIEMKGGVAKLVEATRK